MSTRKPWAELLGQLAGPTTGQTTGQPTIGRPAKPPLNEKLIQCVLDHIENEPDEYDQNVWCEFQGTEDNEYCGTTGCFAGWACLLSTKVREWKYLGAFESRAAALLGLAPDEHYLFVGVEGTTSHAETIAIIKKRLNHIRRMRGLPEVDYSALAAAKAAAKGATDAKTKGDDHGHERPTATK